MNPHHRLASVTLSAAALITACTVGPDYQAPTVPDAGDWSQPADTRSPTDADLAHWWTTLDDPALNALVDKALQSNLTVQQAATRVAEARARRDVAVGGRWPTATASGAASRQKLSENGPTPAGRIPGIPTYQTVYDAGIDASWELDLFGGVQRAVEAAHANLQASQADARAARIAVVAEVARTYLHWRGARAQRDALVGQIAAAEQTNALVALQVEAGAASQADQARAESDLASLQARLPDAEARVTSIGLGLSALLGQPPQPVAALIDAPIRHGDLPALAHIPIGARADLLARRPDVHAAERRLRAANAQVGAATAALYPRLVMTASGGFQALDADAVFDAASQRWSLVPLISWRILDAGRVRAEIRVAEAQDAAAALAFEQAMLNALTEAEQALAQYRHGLDALAQRRVALDAARRSDALAALRYEAGAASLIERLDAERALRGAESALATTHTDAATALVALYKALGGGWQATSATKAIGIAQR